MRASRPWADQGDLDDPPQAVTTLHDYDNSVLGGLYSQAFSQSSYAFGWSEFGEQIWAKNTHTTGSPRNRLTYFDKFAINGSPGAFRHSELFALHSRDLRTYHIDGFSKEARPLATLWEGLPVWSKSVDKLGRDAIDPALAPHKNGIPPKGHGWNGFDFEHLMLDDLYEYYLLTGDPVSHESLREMGECIRTMLVYDPNKAPGSSRGIGWTLRALIKIYQVTGDVRFKNSADELVVSAFNNYGKTPSPVTGLTYHYLTRYPPNGSHISNAYYDCPWQMCVAIHGLLLHHRETGSAMSRQIALDVADYITNYAWNGVAMNEALNVYDHNHVNSNYSNTGTNTWVPSALALVYRHTGNANQINMAQAMYNSIPGMTPWNTSNGWGIYHWWHSYRAVLAGQ